MPLDRGGFGSALIALPVSIIFTSQVKILQNTTKTHTAERKDGMRERIL